MAQSAASTLIVIDEEVEAVLAEFDGDPRRAIRALLDDIAALAEDQPAPLFDMIGFGASADTTHRD